MVTKVKIALLAVLLAIPAVCLPQTKIKTSGIADGAVTTAKLAGDSVTAGKIVDGAVGAAEIDAGAVGTSELATTIDLSGKTLTMPAGNVVQVVNTQTGAVATGTTLIPADDTIPQNTEGNEYMTLAITPRSATSKLKIEVVFFGSASVDTTLTAALFQDATANALAAASLHNATPLSMRTIHFTHYMTAGTTSATTFKVRAGGHAANTTTFNGFSGGRAFGGVAASSITITEISQ